MITDYNHSSYAYETELEAIIYWNLGGSEVRARPNIQKSHGVYLNIKGKDYDHTKKKFVSIKKNRGGFGKGTK